MTTIANLSVKIASDISALTSGLTNADNQLANFARNTGNKFNALRQGMDNFVSGMMPISAILGGGLGLGIKIASDYEVVMAEIEARTGATADEMARLDAFAMQMGAETAFSSQDAAEAMLQLLSSGQNLEQAMTTLPSVLDAAAASGEGLGASADGVTDIMAAFQLGVSKVPAEFQALQTELGVTRDMFVAFGNDAEVPELEALAERMGLTSRQVYEMWNATQQLTPEIENLANQLGVTEDQWAAYGSAARTVSPEIAALIDQTGIAGQRLAEMFTGETPTWFISDIETSATVVDSLARASGASSATMSDLIQAFQNGSAMANMMGISANRTSAIFALFAERGKKGAEAGTLLSSMLKEMDAKTNENRAAWQALGTTLYDADGQIRDFSVVIEDIKVGLQDMTPEEQNAILQELAGSYGILGLQTLVTGQSIEEMETAMASATGASEIADAKLDTFAGRFDELLGSVTTVTTQALTPFMDNVLKPMVEDLTPVVNGIGKWISENPQLTSTILAVAGGLAVVTPVVWGVNSAFGAVSAMVTTVKGGLMAVGWPLALLLGALTLADWGQIGTGVGQTADGLVKFLQGDPASYGLIGDGLKNIGEGLLQIPLTAADTLLGLVGIDLGSAEDNFAGFGTAIQNVGKLIEWTFDDAMYQVNVLALGTLSQFYAVVAALAQVTGDTSSMAMYDARKAEVDGKLMGMATADAFTASLNQGIYDGAQGIALDPATLFQITQDPESVAAGLGERAKDILQLAVQNAVESGDMQFLLQVAPLLGTNALQMDTDFFTNAVQPAREALAGALDAAAWGAANDPSWLTQLQTGLETVGVPVSFANWDTTALSNDIQAGLLTAQNNNGGVLEVGVPISYTVDAATGETSPITVEDFLSSLNLKQLADGATPQLKMTVEDMLADAIANNDPGVIEMLTPLAIALNIDVPGIRQQWNGAMSEALNGVQGYVALGAQVQQVNGQTAVVWYINPDSPTAPKPRTPDGSHRGGLDYVPRDGYLAELHAGEAVLTAEEASAYRGGGRQVIHQYQLASYGQSPHELISFLQRAVQDGAR